MAAAAPVNAGSAHVPRVAPKALEFQAPASPVAQKDILRQQESLKIILEHKYKEEELLKQQQEEWMRQNLIPLLSSDRELPFGLSPIKNEPNSKDSNELIDPTSAIQHSLSLSINDKRTLRPSPRLSAAIRASQARFHSFKEKNDHEEQRSMSILQMGQMDREKNMNPVKKSEVRTSDESIASTATTIVTCYRRVTSSLSSASNTSADLCDFGGYEDEETSGETVISYTTPTLYSSIELVHSRDELEFESRHDKSFSNHESLKAVDTCIGSPRVGGKETFKTSSSNNNQIVNDGAANALGWHVLSPRNGHIDFQSPYKSTAKLQFLEPQDGENTNEPRQPTLKPLRKKKIFRRHSLTPLSTVPKS